jgi:capsular polysaccharide export protein
LFLQGLSTPLFYALGRRLEQQGCTVRRLNICAGDMLFWPDPRAEHYRGRFVDWSRFLAAYLERYKVTDIVLFGDRRPYHRVGISLASRRGIAVHVFDEGYLRPDWITMESDAGWRETLRAGLPSPADHKRVGGGFARRASWDVAFHALNIALRPAYPFYLRHRPQHPLVEGMGWLRRALKRQRLRRDAQRQQAELVRQAVPYFLLPLQLDSDYQIRHRSPFRNMGEVMETVMRSFAAHALGRYELVIKVHPLDNGLVNRRRQIANLAGRHGLSNRVRLLDGGHLPSLIGASQGVVVVNSTTGLTAMHQRKPTLALADPIYKLPGLVSPGSLDEFWNHPVAPRPELVSAFEKVLADHCQVNGSYFTAEGMELAIRNILLRLSQPSYVEGFPAAARSIDRHAWP